MIRSHKIQQSLLLSIMLMVCNIGLSYAQESRIIPKIEPSSISIGEQAELKIRVIYPKGSKAELTLPKDTLVSGVEILSVSTIDSTVVNDKLQELLYSVVVTSFDSATYRLNNIQAIIGGNTVQAENPPSLIVNTVPVNLDKPDEYSDIKGQWKPKFVWTDYLLYLYILLGVILLGILSYFLVRYLRRQKSEQSDAVPVPVLDPYEEAITGMQQLKQDELWERNQIKEYYTRMTDILRHYLSRVYGMETAEKTSTEILSDFNNMVGKDRMYGELKKILQTADLAKFAQYRASSDENITLMNASVAFIEENKPQKQQPEEVATEEGKEVQA